VRVKSLHDKVAVVTGAASGVGLGLALRFADEGMRVVLADIETAALERAVDLVRNRGAQAIGVPTDVRFEEHVQRLADRTIDAFGAVHVLCNNAGVETGGAFTDIPASSWKWVLDVNLFGVIHGCRIFLPLIRRQGQGHIVNTGSGASFSAALPTMAPYATSKFAVLGLSESLDMELRASGEDIHVSLLAPVARTRMMDAERNRPDDVPSTEADPARRSLMAAIAAGTAAFGLDPAEVAALVVDAIRDERFFVIVNPAPALAAVRGRLAWMQDGPASEQTLL
jgi:NAD(P)-dependent dehydrogenase (short-subunit alcohol dehydrogenase family)